MFMFALLLFLFVLVLIRRLCLMVLVLFLGGFDLLGLFVRFGFLVLLFVAYNCFLFDFVLLCCVFDFWLRDLLFCCLFYGVLLGCFAGVL